VHAYAFGRPVGQYTVPAANGLNICVALIATASA